jgi:hypothetical protein
MQKCLFLVLLFCSLTARSQERSPYPLTVSIFNEGVSFPYTQFFTRPVHPGVMVESNHFFKENGRSAWGWSVSVGYYFHRHFANGLFAQGHLNYRYQTSSGVYAQAQLGTGYLHVFRAAAEYKFVNGKYERHGDWGSGRLMPSLGLELGYKIKPNEVLSPRIFTRYQTWIQYPFSPGFIPLLSHTNLHLGYSFYPFKKVKI